MAMYKVPQDVEADDKLLGPFSFRQFVYLFIAGGGIALAVLLFRIFPFLAIIPIPIVLFFLVLALPLKKDQPMETYLAAVVSYYLKPRKRFWVPGQRESTITITAPKKIEPSRVRDITGEEAGNRLSFLSELVDTGGYAIKKAGSSQMQEDFIAEVNNTQDIFETSSSMNLQTQIDQNQYNRHAAAVDKMRKAIEEAENPAAAAAPVIQTHNYINPTASQQMPSVVVSPIISQSVVQPTQQPIQTSQPAAQPIQQSVQMSQSVAQPITQLQTTAPAPQPLTIPEEKQPTEEEIFAEKRKITELAQNSTFSISTIQKEANRKKKKEKDGEVYISLH